MLTIAIDCGDQRPKGHAALAGDLLQTVPELVFKADARLVAFNDNRALRNRRLHGFSPRISHRYYMTAWPFGQEKPPDIKQQLKHAQQQINLTKAYPGRRGDTRST